MAAARNTKDPNTDLKAPAAICSFNASIPNGRSIRLLE
jgi:hypothetical protein